MMTPWKRWGLALINMEDRRFLFAIAGLFFLQRDQGAMDSAKPGTTFGVHRRSLIELTRLGNRLVGVGRRIVRLAMYPKSGE
jgi:hypothetical protein